MSTEHCKRTGRFAQGERNRQLALDFILAHPGAVGPEISAAMGWKKDVSANRMTRMTDDGDVSRVLTNYSYRNTAGGLCNVSTYAYTALRTTTRTAGEVREVMVHNLHSPTKRAQAINAMREEVKPWLIRNVDPDRMPIPNQEGIGSGRRHVYVGGSMA